MFLAVCYDIADDRRRRKASKVLEAFGKRVQRSVFECEIEQRQFVTMRQKLSQIVAEGDRVRYYRLCGSCRDNIEFYGGNDPEKKKKFLIV